MTYSILENFKYGMDSRKIAEGNLVNSLPYLRNVHINKGAEIEKRGKFTDLGPISASAFGLYSSSYDTTGANKLFYVGVSAPDSVSFPSGAPNMYHRIIRADASTDLVKVHCAIVFRGLIFVAAKFTLGGNRFFYNGTEIVDHPAKGGTDDVVMLNFKNKVYVGVGGVVYYCAINDATYWNADPPDGDPVGAGFIEVSAYDSDCASITGMVVYKGNVAFMFYRAIQIWFLDQDDASNRLLQILKNTGMTARQSLVQYGDNDAYYLSYDGIRTMRSRQVSQSFYAFDAGTPIDPFIDLMQTQDEKNAAVSIVEPTTGRIWFFIGTHAYIYTNYPSADIVAWSFYELPTVAATYSAEANGVLYYRTTTNLYQFESNVYDNTEAEVKFPFLTANKPADRKSLIGIDIAARGTWQTEVYLDPLDDTAVCDIGLLEDSTFLDGFSSGLGQATHLSPHFITTSAEKAIISAIALHFSMGESRNG